MATWGILVLKHALHFIIRTLELGEIEWTETHVMNIPSDHPNFESILPALRHVTARSGKKAIKILKSLDLPVPYEFELRIRDSNPAVRIDENAIARDYLDRYAPLTEETLQLYYNRLKLDFTNKMVRTRDNTVRLKGYEIHKSRFPGDRGLKIVIACLTYRCEQIAAYWRLWCDLPIAFEMFYHKETGVYSFEFEFTIQKMSSSKSVLVERYN